MADLGSASATLPGNAYADAFVRGQAREGVSRVQARLGKARHLNDDLADYFAARREVEAAYLKALSRIAKRPFISDPTVLGAFAPVYERLALELGELASVHGELEGRLEEAEAVLRTASTRGEWSRVKEHDESVSAALREIASLESQLAKDQKKAESASSKKVAAAQNKASETAAHLAQANDAWETEAPFAFEAYQRIDQARLDLLKETITKWETAQSDAATRLMSTAEKTMQASLSFDTQAEMTEFILKQGTSKGLPSVQGRPDATIRAQQGASPVTSASARGPAPGAPTPSNGRNGAAPGLAEFGGVGSSTASIHSTGAGAQDTASVAQQQPTGRGSTLKSALTRIGRGRSGKGANEMSTSYGSLPEQPDSMGPPQVPAISSSVSQRAPRLSLSGNDAREGLPQIGMAPLVPTTRGTSTEASPAAPQVDAEGYSIPPPDRKPWEPTAGASLMDEDASEEISDLPRVSGMNISSKAVTPKPEDSAQDQAALERVRSTLLTARTPPTAPSRRNTTRRDRRDVRNTTYNPNLNLDAGTSTATGGGSVASPIAASTTASRFDPDRTQSIVSMTSMSGAAGSPFEAASAGVGGAAAASAPGLRAAVTETVNVIFDGRDIQRIMIVGELSVTLKDIGTTEPLHLRLDAFEELEKAAPNPAFVQSIPDRPGEYRLDVASLVSKGGAGVLLKYQLHVSESRKRDYVPLDVVAQWRCEQHQTSLLCNYTPNTTNKLLASGIDGMPNEVVASTLQDVSFVATIQPSNVAGHMSKPVGTWSAEHKRMFWKLDHTEAASAGKVLARFQVDAPTSPSGVQVRWKVIGRTISALGVNVVSDSTIAPSALRFDSVARSTVSGKYVANPVQS
ncbi:hypothetical protein IE81DRAFT_344781 [Ceraceosorus guamensis]|uniref:MHD domain-containing protein n=1 Tax=Ceraceosorus guamensis TaxID=1522189 RepID=A0A316W6G0_9BASI|nr:hypothetical protein IE81DRAFT_344781 [Ceraceosorus guamensis]PWN45477.1 hypothetical protein IE81DRAFT_344781 [Ceraceosorus guamensis]